MSWLTEDEIAALGFQDAGTNLLIDSNALIIGANFISLGSNIRIDSQVVITAGPEIVSLGDGVHIAHGSKLFGTAGINIQEGAGISSNCSIFSASDNYSSGHLSNPMTDPTKRDVKSKKVILESHVLIGSTSVILPGTKIGFGASVGALTLVHRDVPSGIIVSGNPMRKVGNRNLDLIRTLAKQEPKL